MAGFTLMPHGQNGDDIAFDSVQSGIPARLGNRITGQEASVESWIIFSNHQRPHTAHGGQPPAVVYFSATESDQHVQTVA